MCLVLLSSRTFYCIGLRRLNSSVHTPRTLCQLSGLPPVSARSPSDGRLHGGGAQSPAVASPSAVCVTRVLTTHQRVSELSGTVSSSTPPRHSFTSPAQAEGAQEPNRGTDCGRHGPHAHPPASHSVSISLPITVSAPPSKTFPASRPTSPDFAGVFPCVRIVTSRWRLSHVDIAYPTSVVPTTLRLASSSLSAGPRVAATDLVVHEPVFPSHPATEGQDPSSSLSLLAQGGFPIPSQGLSAQSPLQGAWILQGPSGSAAGQAQVPGGSPLQAPWAFRSVSIMAQMHSDKRFSIRQFSHNK